jgi:DNA-binding transcriptional MerR regulator
MRQAGLRSSELANAAGVNVQTLRYYERRGLLRMPQRSSGGHRFYPPETVTLLRVIKAAQALGFTLDEVADLLETGRRPHATGALRDRAMAKLGEIDEKITHLRAIRAELVKVVEARCNGLTNCTCPDCPMPFDQIGREEFADR